jgi:hypothetical protein
MTRLASIQVFLIAFAGGSIVKTMSAKYSTSQHGLAQRSSMKSESGLQITETQSRVFYCGLLPTRRTRLFYWACSANEKSRHDWRRNGLNVLQV